MAITKLEARVNTSSNSSLKPQSRAKKKLRVLGPGPTGPWTQRGKHKVRYNAVKHGIFSEAILNGRESTAEFNSLFMGLREYFKPKECPRNCLCRNCVRLSGVIEGCFRRNVQRFQRCLNSSSMTRGNVKSSSWRNAIGFHSMECFTIAIIL